jgi:hypothetical protein
MMTAPLSPETEGALRLFIRLLISYRDLQHADQLAEYILGENLHGRGPDEPRLILEALSCAMVIAYCRPFSRNRPTDLPAKFLEGLDPREQETHARLLATRHRLLAHSDAAAWKPRPGALTPTPWGKMVLPRFADVRVPLTREDTEVLRRMASTVMAAIMAERRRLDPLLVDQLEEIPLKGEFFAELLRILREHEPDEGAGNSR